MQRLPVEKAKNKGTVALCSTENLVLLVPKDIQEKEIVTEIIPDAGALVAPIRAGEELGTINVYVRGDKYASVRLTADADVELDGKIVRDQKIHDILTSGTLKAALISLLALLGILIGLRVFFRLHRRQQVQRRLWEREQQRAETGRTVRSAQNSGYPSGRTAAAKASTAITICSTATTGKREPSACSAGGKPVICACTAGAENTAACAPAKKHKHTTGSTEAATAGAKAPPAGISEGSQIRRDKDSTGPAPAFRTENTLFRCAGYLCPDRKKRAVFRKLRGGSGCTPCCVPERIR